jgi:hypothetical protein
VPMLATSKIDKAALQDLLRHRGSRAGSARAANEKEGADG